MRVSLIILLIFCFHLLSRSQTSINDIKLHYDSSNSITLSQRFLSDFDPLKNTKSFIPTNEDYSTVYSLMKDEIISIKLGKEYINNSKNLPDSLFEQLKKILHQYSIQMIFYEGENGKKSVWINAFCDKEISNWKNNIVHVLDGGQCYFNFKIDLITKTIFELKVNGYAIKKQKENFLTVKRK